MSGYPGLNDDFRDLLAALKAAGVSYVIVGAHAMAAHGVPRSTGDLDVFVRPDPDNAQRVIAALGAFGAPLAAHGVRSTDFTQAGTVYQIGLPPRRIDLLTSISGVSFDEAWADHIEVVVDGLTLPFIGRASLLANKRAAARDKDLLDAKLLERV